MRVDEIVEKYLEEKGFDGLVNEDGECGCLCSCCPLASPLYRSSCGFNPHRLVEAAIRNGTSIFLAQLVLTKQGGNRSFFRRHLPSRLRHRHHRRWLPLER
jgi:hypothetical protein